MTKFLFLIVLFSFQSNKLFCQEKPRIYLSGITNGTIKKSQLSDTVALKIIATSSKKITGYIHIYFSGAGFSNVQTFDVPIGGNLSLFINRINGLKSAVKEGTTITIDGYLYQDKATNTKIYFEESTYKVISD